MCDLLNVLVFIRMWIPDDLNGWTNQCLNHSKMKMWSQFAPYHLLNRHYRLSLSPLL